MFLVLGILVILGPEADGWYLFLPDRCDKICLQADLTPFFPFPISVCHLSGSGGGSGQKQVARSAKSKVKVTQEDRQRGGWDR
jgi:hypothetical protein